MKKLILSSGMLAGAAALVLSSAAPVSAHVGVDAPDATKGGWATLSFRVPTESDIASTTALTVAFPEDVDFEYVATRTKPGWRVTQEDGTSVTWTAEKGSGIAPDEFDVFEVRVGPLPDADSIMLPVTQDYSDGTSVAWDQPTPESGEEPERPAPVVTLAEASGDGHGAHGADSADSAGDTSVEASSDESSGVDGWLVGGIAVLALAVGALAASLVRRRPRTP